MRRLSNNKTGIIAMTLGILGVASLSFAYALLESRPARSALQAPDDAGKRLGRVVDGPVTFERHEAAVQSALGCLSRRGFDIDPVPASGKRPTVIQFRVRGMEISEANEILVQCRAEANLDAIENAVLDQQERAPAPEREAAEAYFASCRAARGLDGADGDRAASECYYLTMEETGLYPLGE